MTLTAEERTQLEADLAEARRSLHELEIGGRPSSVGHSGKSISYAPTSAARLRQYIRELEAKLGLRPAARQAPMRARFV